MVRFLFQKKVWQKHVTALAKRNNIAKSTFFFFLNFTEKLGGVHNIAVIQSIFILHRLKVLFSLIHLFNSKSIRGMETLLYTSKENVPHPLLKTQKYCIDTKYYAARILLA